MLGQFLVDLGAGLIPLMILVMLFWNWNTGAAKLPAPPVITIRIIK